MRRDKRNLNVRNMKDTYLYARADMRKVWEAFYTMYQMDFISCDEWHKFFEACKSWEYDSTQNAVVDCMTGDLITYFEG